MPRTPSRKLPVWAMGLANAPTGFVYGFISTAMGILLAARGVSLVQIGTISFIAFSPSFWAWLLAPVLDVHFTKRTYAFALAALAALFLGATVLSLGNLTWFTVSLTASSVCITLYTAAVGAWTPDVLSDAEFDTMSGWFNTANLGFAGVFSLLVILCVRHLPPHIAAALLALLVVAPTALLTMFPAPPVPDGTLRANFAAMGRDLVRILRGSRVWIGLVIFLSPVSAFALTNLFSGFGAQYHASENWVTGLNGPGVAAVCSAGCLLAIPLCRKLQRRSVYVLSGVGAALVAVALGLLPHTLAIYAIGLLAYNFFQGFNYTSLTSLALEITGPRNAVAGTMMAMLTSSANLPISLMVKTDSVVYGAHGLRPMYFVDAASSILTAAVLLFLVLPRMDRWVAKKAVASS
jgi:PAT family beta-lactamase induction signal transducer AmpG